MNSPAFPENPVLIADDEEESLESGEMALRSGGIQNIKCCRDSRKIMGIIESEEIEALLLDLSMPHISGQEILKTVSEQFPEIPVIIITGMNEIDTAIDCMKMGAFDYMVKPVERARLVSGVLNAIDSRGIKRQNRILRECILSRELANPEAFDEIITNDPIIKSIFKYLEAIALTSEPVLIQGETGVGKELFARAIHRASGRTGTFVVVNVAGLDDNVISDTLFGHKKGAFTGADTARSGLIKMAEGGTLVLDEIGDISHQSQVKLLRLIQEHEYFPLGSDLPETTNARIITSTNCDLGKKQAEGSFRKDLFYRLGTHKIDIPPLRQRTRDIAILVEYFLDKASKKLQKKKPTPPKELISLLNNYNFPGNIRELENMIFDAVSRHESHTLSMATFKDHIRDEVKKTPDAGHTPHEDEINVFSELETIPSIKSATQSLIDEAMRRTGGNQSLAAQLLGIAPSSLNKRLKRNLQQ